MTLRIAQIDAFTDTPYAGNPAAVCLLPTPREDAWMQAVAREMSLAETAFLLPRADGFSLRWFTPTVEVDLCGHATLASAHLLWEGGQLDPRVAARFHTRSGLLTAAREGDWIVLDFPTTPAAPCQPPPDLLRALDASPRCVARTRFDYLVEVESESALRALRPDFAALARLPEDPVTGSAHCALGPYWGSRLGKDALVGYQASARGGVVRVRTAGERVLLGGRAVTVLRGELLH